MCNPASMVLTKQKVFWSPITDAHEDIIEEFGLGHLDVDYNNPGIVRVEISPANQDFGLPLEQWHYVVDQDVLPEWYDSIDAEKRVRIALENWVATKVVLRGICEIVKGLKYASGNATVYASGNATVKAYDDATVTAYDDATVTAYDDATVKASGNATVYAYDDATVKASGNATVYAYDDATVIGYMNAQVELCAPNTVFVDRRGSVPVCTVGIERH